MNFVTQNRARYRERKKQGRPRKYADQAAKQKAYRQRQGASAPFEPATRVRHRTHGAGIIINLFAGRAYVAFPGRIWRDLPLTELTATGTARKIPVWADPEVRNLKKRTIQAGIFPSDKSLVYASFPGVNIKDIPVFTRKGEGKARTFKNFSDAINTRIVSLVWRAKGKR